MKKKKILIADDDPAILDAVTLMLEEVGYEVATALDGQKVQDMKEEFPELLLLDLRMSGMDGRDICKHLKAQAMTKHIPVIILSANKDALQIAKECDADDFIAKPFQMDELFTKVAKHIGTAD